MGLPRIVSLFSGAGGLDLGFMQAGFPVVFAIDKSDYAIQTYKRNFPNVVSKSADLVELGATGILEELSEVLVPGESIGVIGGPPCQGFSRANALSRADDPRNALPILYLEIVEALKERYDLTFVLFENVNGILGKKHTGTYNSIVNRFHEMGMTEVVDLYNALDFGVAQTRKRVIIAAFKTSEMAESFQPIKSNSSDLTVRAMISGLPDPQYYSRGLKPGDIPYHPNHWTMRPRSPKFLSDGGGLNAGRCFRRLNWDKPSPTVAYGHREIHVHPEGGRRLSIYEAMQLQGFPRSFVLEGTFSSQVEQVSNAVPPPFARALANAVSVAIKRNAVPVEGS